VVLAIALASAGGDGGGQGDGAATGTPKQSQSSSADSDATQQPKSTNTPASPPPPPPAASSGTADAASASRLNDQGYDLLKGGDPGAAVPLLKRSVEGFRDAGALSNVNYHYALFNLGEALMATDQPAAAIPYLQERLERSDDRRGLVRQTIAKAQAQAQAADGGGAQGARDVPGAKKPRKGEDG